MFSRIAFILIALFWLTMNVLLWRAEFDARNPGGSAVPVGVVWKKVLTAPDSSSLTVLQHGQRIGFCRWITGVGEEFAKLDEAPPQGIVQAVPGYRIQLDGNVGLTDFTNRLRFDGELRLSTNHDWQELNVRLTTRLISWEIQSVAAEQTIRLKAGDGTERFEQVLRFSDFQNPEALLREFGVPFMPGFLSGLGLPSGLQKSSAPALVMKWEAYSGTLRIGHEPVHVYRLQTRLLDRYSVVIFVSRAGEILRAELPEGVVLVNDQLGAL